MRTLISAALLVLLAATSAVAQVYPVPTRVIDSTGVSLGSITFPTTTGVRAATTAGNTVTIQAYDTDTGPGYVNLFVGTSGTTPTAAFSYLTYLNFDGTAGASGYGLRVNAGNIEFKNQGGGWTAIPSAIASAAWSRTGTVLMPATAGDSVVADSALTVGEATTYDGILVTPVVKGAGQFDGTITSVDLTAARTWTLADKNGTFAFTIDKLSAFAATTSAELAGVVSDETGSGAVVFGTSPIFTTDATTGLIASQDVLKLLPANSATRFTGSFTPADLTADVTWTMPAASGTILYQSYASLYYDGDSDNDGTLTPSELTITNADTYYKFTATTAGVEAGDADAVVASDDITVSVAGTYELIMQVSFAPTVASKDIRWALFKEGVAAPNCKTARDAAATSTGSASIACQVALIANDSIDVRGMNATDGAEINVYFLHLTLKRIGS